MILENSDSFEVFDLGDCRVHNVLESTYFLTLCGYLFIFAIVCIHAADIIKNGNRYIMCSLAATHTTLFSMGIVLRA